MTEPTIDHMNEMTTRITESVASLKEAAQRMEEHELMTGQQLRESEVSFGRYIDEIQSAIIELRDFMTQAGVTRFRVIAEHTLQEGEKHLLEIQKATENFNSVIRENIEYLHRTAENSSSWISESIKSLRLNDFRRLMVESVNQIDEVSDNAIKQIMKMVKWFHWRVFGVAIIVAVTISFLTIWFVSDESPWESHKHVVAEREAGKTWYKVWPHLTQEEKNEIQNMMSKYL